MVVEKKANVLENIESEFKRLTKGHSIKGEVKETSLNGIDGLNLKFSAPFKFMDYVVGVKASLGNFKNLNPDTIFVKRTFSDVADGKVNVEGDYDIDSKTLDVDLEWVGDGVSVSARGNNKDLLTELAAKAKHTFEGSKAVVADLGASYHMLTKKIAGSASVHLDSTTAKVAYDTEEEDPVVSVSYKHDRNTITPSYSTKTGDITIGVSRKLESGKLDAEVHPGDKVVVEWEDNGAHGVWKTKVDVPLGDDHKNTKVSFARDWNL